MKTFISSTMAVMAISMAGCSSVSAKPSGYQGRVIEFKSDMAGFDTRTFFYEGQAEVIAVDAQFTPELAKQSILHLRKLTQKPITWLVITHPNPDKFNGASVFKSLGARIISSKATAAAIPEVHAYKEYFFVEMAKMFQKGNYPQPVAVDQTFENQTDLVLRGGERLYLKELSQPGVSSTQTIAYVRSANAVFVGDLVHYKAHAWLEGGIVGGKPTPAIDGWLANLKELAALVPPTTRVYGGRGVTADLKTSLAEQYQYLQAARALIRKELKALGTKASGFNGPNAGAMYKALAAKFQAHFQGYELAYLIEYGAYGLVQSELAAMKVQR